MNGNADPADRFGRRLPGPGEVLKPLAARLLWHAGLIGLAGWLRRAWRGPRLIVLCYHRVDADASLPAHSAHPSEFARQLDWYARRFAILPLASVAGYLAGREKLAGDAIALTFDDGYADNYRTVLPLLNNRRMPAVFFIATDPLFRRVPYWYDELWLRLRHWNRQAPGPGVAAKLPNVLVEALEGSRSRPGKSGLQRILHCSKGLDAQARGVFLEWLKSGQQRHETPVCETMTPEEARESAKLGVELGGHTRSHPSLARIPAYECRIEIVEALREFSDAGFPIRFFAYPFGEAVDVGGSSGYPRKVLAEMTPETSRNTPAGSGRVPPVHLAVTTEERAVRPGDDPLLVPRKVITAQDLPQIALKLEMLAWRK